MMTEIRHICTAKGNLLPFGDQSLENCKIRINTFCSPKDITFEFKDKNDYIIIGDLKMAITQFILNFQLK
jgi:hypothetical protein